MKGDRPHDDKLFRLDAFDRLDRLVLAVSTLGRSGLVKLGKTDKMKVQKSCPFKGTEGTLDCRISPVPQQECWRPSPQNIIEQPEGMAMIAEAWLDNQ